MDTSCTKCTLEEGHEGPDNEEWKMKIIVLKNGPLNGQSQILNEENQQEYNILIKNKEYIYKDTGKKDILNRAIFELVVSVW